MGERIGMFLWSLAKDAVMGLGMILVIVGIGVLGGKGLEWVVMGYPKVVTVALCCIVGYLGWERIWQLWKATRPSSPEGGHGG